jgi:putative membrane protein
LCPSTGGQRGSAQLRTQPFDVLRWTGDDTPIRGGDEMPGFLARLLVTSVGLMIASELVSGIEFAGLGSLFFAALVLGCVNAIVRPAVVFLTIPFTLVTLGFFLFVVNAAMLGLTAFFVPGFFVAGFGPALFGSIIVSITGMLASWYIGPKGKVDVLIVGRG